MEVAKFLLVAWFFILFWWIFRAIAKSGARRPDEQMPDWLVGDGKGSSRDRDGA